MNAETRTVAKDEDRVCDVCHQFTGWSWLGYPDGRMLCFECAYEALYIVAKERLMKGGPS